jgi:hypothetical protein
MGKKRWGIRDGRWEMEGLGWRAVEGKREIDSNYLLINELGAKKKCNQISWCRKKLYFSPGFS